MAQNDASIDPVLRGFHPAVAAWFAATFDAPTEPQRLAWPAIRRRRHTLIAAPTGSGKTLAAFLAAIDELVRLGLAPHDGRPDGRLADETRVVYVSPLKALSNDIHKNLEQPLAGIARELAAAGLPPVEIRPLVRTGDTPSSARTAMVKRPPHLLVTTPESLAILLTSEGGRRILGTASTVIVDEIHAVAGSKRGSHLALSLERLERLVASSGRSLTRIGLSATQKPIEEVARFLVGAGDAGEGEPACEILDVGHRRDLDLAVEIPDSPLAAVMSNEVWEEVYDRLAELIRAHRTTLVFVNTRRLAERATRHLTERLGAETVTSHHGSLSKERRLDAEERLKAGELAALVTTSSLEMGIDVGEVDLVCQLGSTRSIATLLQRVGRSGHRLTATPKGRVFPLTRDELAECAALLDSVGRGELDRLEIPEAPIDILAQTIVAEVAAREEMTEDELFALVRRAHPYRELARETFDEVVGMLADGFATRFGRRGAYLHHDAVSGRLRARRGARLTAITSGGAIPDTADFDVVLEPDAVRVGSVDEDFAVESMPGDVFQLGNASWRILRIEQGRVRVEDAAGQPPSIPFWFGEAPARTRELSASVSRLRQRVEATLSSAADNGAEDGPATATQALIDDLGLPPAAAQQLVTYLTASRRLLGTLPTQETIVLERFFDSAGDHHLVLHSPFGSRVNRAWGLALRKRFCRKFNFELQAAATEDAVLLSLGPSHSFPLDDVFAFLKTATVRDLLVQALLDSPMFGVRWRWNASRALALPRFRGGRRVPPPLLRQAAEDLVAVVFPDQLACLETISGDREVPDHPLVRETLRDCLEEAMDIVTLEQVLSRVEAGEISLVARDLPEPSPLAHEILNAMPYTFLDDAPLEERRSRAVVTRRWLDPDSADDLGRLDAAAIERVRDEAAPAAESPDELHDAMVVHGWLPAPAAGSPAAAAWKPLFEALVEDRRAAVLRPGSAAEGASRPELWVAAERLPQITAAFPGAALEPAIEAPVRLAHDWQPEAALVELVRGRLQALGPVIAGALAAEAGMPVPRIDAALLALESEGFVLRGRFSPGLPDGELEWCERRLLARIHRYTLDRLRREIRPVGRADLSRFLVAWQRIEPEARGEGMEALAATLDLLEGFEAPAAAWEGDLLPARVADYEPGWLDALCLSGRYVWARLTPPAENGSGPRRGGPIKTTPIALVRRERLAGFLEIARPAEPDASSEAPPVPAALSAEAVALHQALVDRGASFCGDLARHAGLLHTQTENGLGELVAAGLVTSDSFAGLRALLVPSAKRPKPGSARSARSRRSRFGAGAGIGGSLDVERAGRWSLLPAVARPQGLAPWETASPEALEIAVDALLHRYGIVFRRLLDRETVAPPWRDLLRALHRLEARGEIRGGRFVDGFSGEQFALSEAVGKLRSVRRDARRAREAGVAGLATAPGVKISVSGADPLNLVGILVPGRRLPALAGNRVLYVGGVPRAVREAGEVRFLGGAGNGDDHGPEADAAELWQAQRALESRPVPPALRPYLGHSA